MSVCVRDHRSLRSSLVLVISRHVELTPFDAHCCHMGTAVKHSVPDRIKPSFVIFCNPGTLTLMVERQSARMTKITNDGLTRSGTGCFIDVPTWQQWASNSLTIIMTPVKRHVRNSPYVRRISGTIRRTTIVNIYFISQH